MGYITEFAGRFNLDRPLTQEHANYLNRFNQTRRVKRDVNVIEPLPDPVRLAVNLPIGIEGEYFVDSDKRDASVIDYNSPSTSQPGLWCNWKPTSDNRGIECDGMEKFYYYTEWLEYLLKNFIVPWGYILNGTVSWQGEDPTDQGEIVVTDNIIKVMASRKVLRRQKKVLAQQQAIINKMLHTFGKEVVVLAKPQPDGTFA